MESIKELIRRYLTLRNHIREAGLTNAHLPIDLWSLYCGMRDLVGESLWLQAWDAVQSEEKKKEEIEERDGG